jgi:FkbM family methyltransferase
MKVFNLNLTRAKDTALDSNFDIPRQSLIKECDLVVDIGANNGQWMNSIRNHGYKGEAICIEPIKENYLKLKTRNFDKTTTLNCAIGNKNGYIYINQASNDGQSSSILELDSYHKSAAPEIKWLGRKKVKIYKLSRILETSQHNKIFVKIDTQGYEFEVLKSINKRTLTKILAFEIETNLVSTYKNVTVIEDVIKLLRGFGFKPFRLQNGFGMPNFGQQLQVDIIFVRNE